MERPYFNRVARMIRKGAIHIAPTAGRCLGGAIALHGVVTTSPVEFVEGAVIYKLSSIATVNRDRNGGQNTGHPPADNGDTKPE